MSLLDNNTGWNGQDEIDLETLDEIEKDEAALMIRLGWHHGTDQFDDDDSENVGEAKAQFEATCVEIQAALLGIAVEFINRKHELEDLIKETQRLIDDFPAELEESCANVDLEGAVDSMENALSELEDCMQELDYADTDLQESIDDLDQIDD